jgi:hypothetical protein
MHLPPDSYFYGKDPESFFIDNSLVYSDLSDCDLIVAGGDLNARTREEPDFIFDIDGCTKPRYNPDPDKNNHGEHFLQFLKDNRALICNGRVTPEYNDFTYVCPRGRSVPDYMYCPADHLKYCTSVKVHRVSDVINEFKLTVPYSLPDHSILKSEFDISSLPLGPAPTGAGAGGPPGGAPGAPTVPAQCTKDKNRKNIRKINQDFLSSPEIIKLIDDKITKLESLSHSQSQVDIIYSEITSIFMDEINKLPDISDSKSKSARRSFRKSAPFWNQELRDLWDSRCECENLYLSYKCQGAEQRPGKRALQHNYKLAQQCFDKRFRQLKREHEKKAFHELADLAEKATSDPTEMWKRLKALSDHKPSSIMMEIVREDGTISSDVAEILERWHKDFSQCFQGLKDDPDLAYDDEFLNKITHLKSEFDKLSPHDQQSNSAFDSTSLNSEITLEEVSNAIDKSKLGKAFLFIPNEAMKNQPAKKLLHKLFNLFFHSGLTPDNWLMSDLKPLFKGGDKNPRSPLDHRPICIMSCVAKIYSCVLNSRIQNHLNTNDLLSDTQNGFRAGRSCIDHIFSLITILRNRKLNNKSTFLCFVDFRRAFDSVNHILLFHVLYSTFGIVGKMYNTLKSLYSHPVTRVILTASDTMYKTDYFHCPLGVKQGDIISPTLFSMFVHSLTTELDESGIGISLQLPPAPPPPPPAPPPFFYHPSQPAPPHPTSPPNPAPPTHPAPPPHPASAPHPAPAPPPSPSPLPAEFLVSHLIYADDLVCLAETENDLQSLINIVRSWCIKYRLEANLLKTEVMHVRKPLVPRSRYIFKLGSRKINYCQSYKYLGLYIDQFLNFEKMSNSLLDPAKRALNAVICKMIKNKGFPFNIFQMLYNACVTSVKDYGHEVIGFHEFSGATLLHNKAIRSYLGVGNSANLCGIRAEMGFPEPRSRTQSKMFRFYLHLKSLPDHRLTKKILLHDQHFSDINPNLVTWTKEVSSIILRNNLLFSLDHFGSKSLVEMLNKSLLCKDLEMFSKQCARSPRLRTYIKLYSPFVNRETTNIYTRMRLPFIVRKRLAQIRLGVLPIRIETDRYSKEKTPAAERYCRQPVCVQGGQPAVEDEVHFLINCPEYRSQREEMMAGLNIAGWSNFSDVDKFRYLLTSQPILNKIGQFIIKAFDKRSNL